MNVCPKCEGKKTMSITVSYGWPGHETKPSETSEQRCVHCNGTGEVSDEDLEVINYEDNMWCECGNKNDAVDFYEDGEHPEIHKHHYRCRNCKGVAQIG